jgi:hypothetical protein
MKRNMLELFFCLLFISTAFISCNRVSEFEDFSEFKKIKGTWIDKDSYALSCIDFYSDKQASFCYYNKNFVRRDIFNYAIRDNKITIDFTNDNDATKTIHNLIFHNNNTIEISGLTAIPENPNKIYYRCKIVTERKNDTIIIGLNELFYDKVFDFRLQIDSVLEDSRCPNGAECIWAGNAKVQLDLIVEGNYHYQFNLNTNGISQRDTTIREINYKLIDVLPYPDIHIKYGYDAYRVKILATKQ